MSQLINFPVSENENSNKTGVFTSPSTGNNSSLLHCLMSSSENCVGYYKSINEGFNFSLKESFENNVSEGDLLQKGFNLFGEDDSIFLFDRPDVKALLITLYAVVFITGFVGNLIVLIVMFHHPRMRSTTNFFLTNLAIADFCVTIFCVLQNLSLYLAQSWIFGNFLCKMYNFVNSLSHTASVMILVVNCIERYVAILRPFRARIILRHRNLLVVLLIVWISSGIYCSPRLLYFRAVTHKLPNDQYTEVICIADRGMFDSRTSDTISFVLLYLIPLVIISALYIKIARFLWVQGVQDPTIRRNFANEVPTICKGVQRYEDKQYPSTPCSSKSSYLSEVSAGGNLRSHPAFSGEPLSHGYKRANRTWRMRASFRSTKTSFKDKFNSNDVIRKWRKVVKLLVAVVTCFAVCNLPYHLRKMLLYYYSGYDVTTNLALMATPLTQVLTYLNSALNPILYCFMSHNFRFCIKEVLTCQYSWRGKRRKYRNNCSSQHASVPQLRMDCRNENSESSPRLQSNNRRNKSHIICGSTF